jgi:putative transposase
MARPLRVEFPDAIYHVMARGNGRQAIFHGDDDYRRLTDGLATTVGRTGWQVMAYVWMPNHIHLFLKTPQPNLSLGMQYLLSGYANWYAKRRQRTGHLFQGRFKAELVEDESYFWALSRYVHLNPVRGKRPLATHPRDWPWSSYRGYCRASERVDWLAYDEILRAWQGEMGGSDAGKAYCRYVESGLKDDPPSPLREARGGWLLGSEAFVEQIKGLLNKPQLLDQVPQASLLARLSASEVISSVASYFGTTPELYQTRRSAAPGRDLAAWMAHRLTNATLRELSHAFGLSHSDSVSNLFRRAELAMLESPSLIKQEKQLRKLLLKQ